MQENNTQLEITEQPDNQNVGPSVNTAIQTPAFADDVVFTHTKRVAKMMSMSDLVPENYRGEKNIPNVMIALEMAHRIGASPLQVMQNLYVVHGKPSWSSQFIIASINSCGKFSPLRFDVDGEGDNLSCYAWAYDKATNDKLAGPKITMNMAKAEGWTTKNGSKWKTMPELMIRYRAAAFFGRLYAPEIMMGMQSVEELHDIDTTEVAKSAAKNIQQVMAEKLNYDRQ